jgi:hypothetical protein
LKLNRLNDLVREQAFMKESAGVLMTIVFVSYALTVLLGPP